MLQAVIQTTAVLHDQAPSSLNELPSELWHVSEMQRGNEITYNLV